MGVWSRPSPPELGGSEREFRQPPGLSYPGVPAAEARAQAFVRQKKLATLPHEPCISGRWTTDKTPGRSTPYSFCEELKHILLLDGAYGAGG